MWGAHRLAGRAPAGEMNNSSERRGGRRWRAASPPRPASVWLGRLLLFLVVLFTFHLKPGNSGSYDENSTSPVSTSAGSEEGAGMRAPGSGR